MAERIKFDPLRSACGRSFGETHSSLSHITIRPISLSPCFRGGVKLSLSLRAEIWDDCEFKNPVKAQPLLLNLERTVVAKLRAAREQAEGRTSSRGHPLDAEGRPKVTARLFSRTHAARSSSE